MAKLLEQLTNIWTARVLVIVGLVFGHVPIGRRSAISGMRIFCWSIRPSLRRMAITTSFVKPFGDLAGIAAILAIIFAAPKFRNPALWWIMLITMFGIFAPFWIGAPFMTELRAPNMNAEIAHLRMAVPAVIGCFLAKRYYFESQ